MDDLPPDVAARHAQMLAELARMELSLAETLMQRAAQADPFDAVPLLEQAVALVASSMRAEALGRRRPDARRVARRRRQ